MSQLMELDIVSAEAAIYTGKAKFLSANGIAGELGIHPGHTALITALKPGQIMAKLADGTDEVFYISGGMLEVQPHSVTVLADTAIRADDIDEAAAKLVKERAEKALSEQASEIEYSRALTELAEAAAQLKAIQSLRKKSKR